VAGRLGGGAGFSGASFLRRGLDTERTLASSRPLGIGSRRTAWRAFAAGRAVRLGKTAGSGAASTSGNPTSAASGGGAGGFSRDGSSCRASATALAASAAFPAADQRTRTLPMAPQGRRAGEFSP
jgi:hypothetical protein